MLATHAGSRLQGRQACSGQKAANTTIQDEQITLRDSVDIARLLEFCDVDALADDPRLGLDGLNRDLFGDAESSRYDITAKARSEHFNSVLELGGALLEEDR